MKIQMTLNDSTLDLVIAQLRTVLEAPYFMYNDTKYAGGKVTAYLVKDASEAICGKKRPMIHFVYNGTFRDYFFEGDTVILYGVDKVVVKGETEKVFSKTAVTDAEAKIIAAYEQLNKEDKEEWDEFIKYLYGEN